MNDIAKQGNAGEMLGEQQKGKRPSSGTSTFSGSSTAISLEVMEPSSEFSTSDASFQRKMFSNDQVPIKLHRPSTRKTNSLEDITINKLDFSKVDICGRDKEITQLREAFETSMTSKQLLMLSGYSGTGKTCLARTLEQVAERKNGLYVEGKFDQNFLSSSQPYSAFAAICGTICSRILDLENRSELCEKLEESLGSELGVLLRVFPILEEILSVSPAQAASHNGTDKDPHNPAEAKFRLNFAFCRFIRVICRELSPLVLVLDDLQWADVPTLDLL